MVQKLLTAFNTPRSVLTACLLPHRKDPEHPTRDNLVEMDIKSLRDTRVLLENVRPTS